jgi:hypothetical protein
MPKGELRKYLMTETPDPQWAGHPGREDGCSLVADLLLVKDGGRHRTLCQDLSSMPARQDFMAA